MNIPLVNLKAQYLTMASEIDAAIRRVVESTIFVLGPETRSFEEEFASYCEVEHAVCVSNGTDALRLSLIALGVETGSEVITVPDTFYATGEAIASVGATPVFVDVDPATKTMDPAALEDAITAKTRVLLPVHLYGHPADMNPILEIAHRHDLPVLEDAAQAHGARYRGKRVGGLGKMAIFSFYPSKNLGAYGEAGCVTTNDAELAQQVRLLRDCGRSSKYLHVQRGFNHRMDEIQAAILRDKLPHLDQWNRYRRRHVALYQRLLADLPEIQLLRTSNDCESVHHVMVIELDNRDQIHGKLEALGIGTGIHYALPLHLQPAFRYLGYSEGEFPVTEASCRRVLSLPLYPELTKQQIAFVTGQLRTLLTA